MGVPSIKESWMHLGLPTLFEVWGTLVLTGFLKKG